MIQYSYDSYGLPKVISGSTLVDFRNYTGNKYSNVRLFTGREHDKETGYYYLRARYYNSDTGKFISRDPIGQNDQINLYTYVANSPLKYVDRMGKEMILIITGKIANNEEQQSLFAGTYQYMERNREREGNSKNNIVYITGIDTPEEFNEKVKPYLGNIKEVIYIEHGYQGKSAGQITTDNVGKLNPLKVDNNDNPSMLLISCQAGRGGSNSIAQAISNILDITVQASDQNVLANISYDDLETDNFKHSVGKPYPDNQKDWIYFNSNH